MHKTLVIIATAIVLVVGFAAASWIGLREPALTVIQSTEPNPVTFDTSAPVEERIRALEQAVSEEREVRQLLQEEIFYLTAELDRLHAVEQQPEVGSEEVSAEELQERQRYAMYRAAGETRVKGLIDAGFEPTVAQWIVQRESELEMDALRARYEAQRSDDPSAWFRSRYDASNALREELGDAQYERYLAATGRSTSVLISNVIESSPGRTAGLLPGDEIVSYDGKRVFSMDDIVQQTMQGEPGQNVTVDLRRDGVLMQVVLPRGPIGISGGRRR